MKSLSFLIETGMERASLVLNAQAITDKFQTMAETLAKIEASDVMPMMDSMKENFGPEVAQRFEQVVTEKLRDLTEALRAARDEVGNEILRMEASVNGEPVSDMNTGGEFDAGNDMAGAEMGDEEMPAADGEMGAEMGDEAPSDELVGDDAAMDAPMGDDEGDDQSKFDSLFSKEGSAAAGRLRRESVDRSGAAALRESSDPDRLVRGLAAKRLREGVELQAVLDQVSAHFEIDRTDVIDILIAGRKTK